MSARPKPDPETPPWPAPRFRVLSARADLEAWAQALALRPPTAVGLLAPASADTVHANPGMPRPEPSGPLAFAQAGDAPGEAALVTIVESSREDDAAALSAVFRALSSSYFVLDDAKRTLRWLRDQGLSLGPRRGCLRTAATLLAQGADKRRDDRPLAWLAASYLGHELPGSFAGSLVGLHSPQARLRDLATQASALVPLMQLLTPQLRALELVRIFELENRLLETVLDLEDAGIGVDAALLQRTIEAWHRELQGATCPDRVARLTKLISTYGHWAFDFVGLDGRIHAQFHPLAADTGRFSCTEPNLQQVPREDTAPGLRAAFVPAPGHVFVVADYAQIELRVAAELAPCAALLQVFREGRDPHRATAATLIRKPEHEVSAHERRLAKAVNFGFLFGMGAPRFREYALSSYGVEMTLDEAKAAKNAFLATFPGIAAWHRRIAALGQSRADEDIVVKTRLGRRRRFPLGEFSFSAALNIPVQGTAAEGFKLAMIELGPALRALGGRGVLCVHDEYVAEVPRDHAEAAREVVTATMIEGMSRVVPGVPIVVDARIANHWGHT